MLPVGVPAPANTKTPVMDRMALRSVKAYLNSCRSMDDTTDESLESLECDALVEAGGAQVAIRRGMRGDFDALDDKKQGRFRRIMELWCVNQKLTPEMFNANEGRSPQGNLLLQAFKAFKVRLYGFARPVQGIRTFIVIDADPAKKQDRADPGILKRAKGRADEIGRGKSK